MCGFIKTYADIFHLDQYQEEIENMEGFGKKSYAKLQSSIEKARETTLPKVIYSLGIENIGLANAKMICKEFEYNIKKLENATVEEMNQIDGVGEVIARKFVEYFANEHHKQEFENLLKELSLQDQDVVKEEQIFNGINFVITGSVVHFANRNEVKELIEKKGGKVTGSVTSKTNYLINNDTQSTSSKNKKARELGIPIISEEEFIDMLK